MKYAIYQTEIIPADPESNRQNVRDWILEQVKHDKPDTVVLPEMWNTGYALTKLEQTADQDAAPTVSFLGDLARTHQINIIGGSIANKKSGQLYNTSLVFNRDGEIVYQYDKIHLVPMLNEHLYLTGGQEKAHIFELDHIKMGLIICYDLRFPELARQLALQGAQVLHIVAQWPDVRKDHWNYLQIARAIENQFYVVSCNTVGENEDTTFAGCSMIIDPWGSVLTAGDPKLRTTLKCKIDLNTVPKIRKDVPVFSSRVPNLYESL
jgi:predicted amidohydrolase